MSSLPKLTLYTAKITVFGQRVKILLHHLKVPYDEVLISLDQPREPWFLAISPQGLVPALEVEDTASGRKETVVESALICHFLLDLARGWGGEFASRANEVFPAGHDLATAVKRYRMGLFLDVSFGKLRAAGRIVQQQRTEEAQQGFLAATKELDSVCPQPGYYFDDNETITLVEVVAGPYLMRVDAYMRWGLTPGADGMADKYQAEAPRFYAWMKKLAADENIKADAWDDEAERKYTIARLAKARSQAQ